MLLNYGFIQVTDDGFITINEGIVREKVKDYIRIIYDIEIIREEEKIKFIFRGNGLIFSQKFL